MYKDFVDDCHQFEMVPQQAFMWHANVSPDDNVVRQVILGRGAVRHGEIKLRLVGCKDRLWCLAQTRNKYLEQSTWM